MWRGHDAQPKHWDIETTRSFENGKQKTSKADAGGDVKISSISYGPIAPQTRDSRQQAATFTDRLRDISSPSTGIVSKYIQIIVVPGPLPSVRYCYCQHSRRYSFDFFASYKKLYWFFLFLFLHDIVTLDADGQWPQLHFHEPLES